MNTSNSSMRISQIMISKGFGGAERLFVDISLCLADAGHKVQAICHPKFYGLSMLSHPNIKIDHLNAHWDWSPLARFRLKKILKIFKPQIIHSHLCRASAIAGDTGKSLNIMVSANLHNYVKLKYYRNINHFFPGTEDQKNYLIKNRILADQITVIPHFSRLNIVEQNNIDLPDNKSPLLFVSYGRFVKKKGFHILLKSIRRLHDKGIPARLNLGGDGPEKNNLCKQIKELGLKEAVTLSGWVDDVPKFLSQSPYFILPSLDEAFGIVILEAMAQGKIIIASKSQGPKAILDHKSAYLFSINDSEALTKALITAIKDPDALNRAKTSLKLYKEKYSPESVIPRFEKAYKKIARFT